MVNNKEEAESLARYVQDLVSTTARFTENETQIEGETMVKLRAFEAYVVFIFRRSYLMSSLISTLASVHGNLEKFTAQGGFRQGVSHIRNKEILAGCDTQIRRSFTQLQVRACRRKDVNKADLRSHRSICRWMRSGYSPA